MKYAIVAHSLDYTNMLTICYLNENFPFSQIAKELSYLYPFKFSVKKGEPLNIEDFKFLSSKYKLPIFFKLKTQDKKQKNICFFTPKIFDLERNITLFQYNKTPYTSKNEKICLIFGENEILERGPILEDAILYGPKYFVFIGDENISGKNRDTIPTLMARYANCCGVNSKNILKIRTNEVMESIIESKELLKTFFDLELNNAVIACSKNKIQKIAKVVRKLRKEGVLNEKIRYIC